MTIVEPEVGAAGFLAALTAHGYAAVQQNEFAEFPYAVEVGSRAGQLFRVGLQIPGDWPLSPPPGPHISPRIGRPYGAVSVVYRPSTGATRTTAIVAEVIWPADGERLIHGNVSLTSGYFLRAAARAAETGAGLGLVHSHPGGDGWQRLSHDDRAAEAGNAAVLTGLPLLGLTYATGDAGYSARLWNRTVPASTFRSGARTSGSSATGSRSRGTASCARRPGCGRCKTAPSPHGDQQSRPT